jgi:transcriptional regulator
MYIPHHYRNEDFSEVKDFLVQNAFAILISQVEGRPWATHIPLELDMDKDGRDLLVGHVARANPQWKYFSEESEVLCIFNGPHSYVSSSWYREEEVPTWNYIAVHIYGSLKILDEPAVLESLRKLVEKYEQNSKDPISIGNLSKKTMRQIKGIVGFKIEINEIQAAYKLSQGREQDHPKIIGELEETGIAGSKKIALAMKKGS